MVYRFGMAKDVLIRVNLRLTESERVRLQKVFEHARARSKGYVSASDVVKELCGLRPMAAVTEQDRQYLIDSYREEE